MDNAACRQIFTEIKEADLKNTKRKKPSAVWWILTLIFPVFVYIMSEAIYSDSFAHILNIIFKTPLKMVFSLIPMYLCYMGVWLALKRVWPAAWLLGGAFYVFSVIQFFKYQILADNLYPWEFSLARNAGSFFEFLSDIRISVSCVAFLLILILYCVILAMRGPRFEFNWAVRAVSGVLLCVLCFYYLTGVFVREGVYPKLTVHVNSMMDQKENYEINGFVSAFLLNAGSIKLKTPKNYGEKYIQSVMERFKPSEDLSGDMENPDVVVILAEAFFDPKNFTGTYFSIDPTANFDMIKNENYGGYMITNTFGGGTARPEFEVLTSMSMSQMPSGSLPYQQYVKDDIWAFPRYFKDLNYDTIAIHPYHKTFYNRDIAYPMLGFDSFKGMDDLETEITHRSHYISDDTFMNEIIFELSKDKDKPSFIFGISMENHGLYKVKFADSEYEIDVENDKYTENELKMVRNFTQGIYDFDRALLKLYEFAKQREKPTVVLVFGDHLPAMAGDYEPYVKSGYISTGDYFSWTQDDTLNMYRCPYLMFSNYDTGREYAADGMNVSPFHLINLLCDYIKAPKNEYMQMLMEFFELSPIYNGMIGYYSDDGDEAKSYDALHWLFTFDMLKGGKYSLK